MRRLKPMHSSILGVLRESKLFMSKRAICKKIGYVEERRKDWLKRYLFDLVAYDLVVMSSNKKYGLVDYEKKIWTPVTKKSGL